jgi:RNA polymerase sigma factor (TIGR02999 family)
MNEFTRILSAVQHGDRHAAEQLLPLVYDELRKLASQRLLAERPGQTLQATALVHAAYLRLVDVEQAQRWDGRGHFFAAAAEAMRRILIDNARRKGRSKHGGQLKRVNLDEAAAVTAEPTAATDDLLALDEALSKFAVKEPAKAELIKLRFFTGLTIPQAAEVLGISEATAERYWTFARAWLYCELERPADAEAEAEAQADSKKSSPS